MNILHLALVSAGIAALAAPASAVTLFSEDFSGATPGTYGVGAIPGAQFNVTTANVDLVGVLNGNYFSCANNPGGNCLDLVGNTGAGGIASAPTFALTAGDTYTVKFNAVLQGYAPGQGSTTFTVGLGSLTQTEMVNGTSRQFSLTFTPLVGQTNAALAFTTVIPGDTVHGAVLDHISLSMTGGGAVPEPASWTMMILGLGAAGACLRSQRRRAVPTVAA